MNRENNLAYDLSIYENDLDNHIPEKIQNRKLKIQIKFKKKTLLIKKSLAVLQVATLLAATWGLISVQSNITDYVCKTSEIEQEITILESEKTYYEFAYNNRMSLSEIENYAVNNLGMIKSDLANVHYLELNDENAVIISNEPATEIEAIMLHFWNTFLGN